MPLNDYLARIPKKAERLALDPKFVASKTSGASTEYSFNLNQTEAAEASAPIATKAKLRGKECTLVSQDEHRAGTKLYNNFFFNMLARECGPDVAEKACSRNGVDPLHDIEKPLSSTKAKAITRDAIKARDKIKQQNRAGAKAYLKQETHEYFQTTTYRSGEPLSPADRAARFDSFFNALNEHDKGTHKLGPQDFEALLDKLAGRRRSPRHDSAELSKTVMFADGPGKDSTKLIEKELAPSPRAQGALSHRATRSEPNEQANQRTKEALDKANDLLANSSLKAQSKRDAITARSNQHLASHLKKVENAYTALKAEQPQDSMLQAKRARALHQLNDHHAELKEIYLDRKAAAFIQDLTVFAIFEGRPQDAGKRGFGASGFTSKQFSTANEDGPQQFLDRVDRFIAEFATAPLTLAEVARQNAPADGSPMRERTRTPGHTDAAVQQLRQERLAQLKMLRERAETAALLANPTTISAIEKLLKWANSARDPNKIPAGLVLNGVVRARDAFEQMGIVPWDENDPHYELVRGVLELEARLDRERYGSAVANYYEVMAKAKTRMQTASDGSHGPDKALAMLNDLTTQLWGLQVPAQSPAQVKLSHALMLAKIDTLRAEMLAQSASSKARAPQQGAAAPAVGQPAKNPATPHPATPHLATPHPATPQQPATPTVTRSAAEPANRPANRPTPPIRRGPQPQTGASPTASANQAVRATPVAPTPLAAPTFPASRTVPAVPGAAVPGAATPSAATALASAAAGMRAGRDAAVKQPEPIKPQPIKPASINPQPQRKPLLTPMAQPSVRPRSAQPVEPPRAPAPAQPTTAAEFDRFANWHSGVLKRFENEPTDKALLDQLEASLAAMRTARTFNTYDSNRRNHLAGQLSHAVTTATTTLAARAADDALQRSKAASTATPNPPAQQQPPSYNGGDNRSSRSGVTPAMVSRTAAQSANTRASTVNPTPAGPQPNRFTTAPLATSNNPPQSAPRAFPSAPILQTPAARFSQANGADATARPVPRQAVRPLTSNAVPGGQPPLGSAPLGSAPLVGTPSNPHSMAPRSRAAFAGTPATAAPGTRAPAAAQASGTSAGAKNGFEVNKQRIAEHVHLYAQRAATKTTWELEEINKLTGFIQFLENLKPNLTSTQNVELDAFVQRLNLSLDTAASRIA